MRKKTAALYRRHPDTTQLIFCDYSTPKGEDLKQASRRKSELEFLLTNEESAYKKKLAECEAEARSIKASMEYSLP